MNKIKGESSVMVFKPVGVGQKGLSEKAKKEGTMVFLLWQITTVGDGQEIGLRAITKKPKRANVFESLCENRDKRQKITNNIYRVDPVLADHLLAYDSLLHKEFLK